MAFLYVFIGGGFGSMCRFALAQLIPWKPGTIPWATFSANLLSCILIGCLIGLLNKSLINDQTKWMLMVGFCGGFSTFSTFSNEIFTLLQAGNIPLAIGYILLSILLCLLGIFIGLKLSLVF